MATISIADLKMLREQLGTGMSDTKAALEEAGIRVADSPSHIPQLLREAGVR